MDFGLLYENDKGEYVVLNDVRMADIRLASLVYLPCLRQHILRAYCTFASKQAVSITLFGPRPNNNNNNNNNDIDNKKFFYTDIIILSLFYFSYSFTVYSRQLVIPTVDSFLWRGQDLNSGLPICKFNSVNLSISNVPAYQVLFHFQTYDAMAI